MSDVIRVSVDNADGELRSFQQWLRDEPDVRRHAVISLEAGDVGEGEMGGVLDVVKLVIDTNFQILNFGLAYVAWRATRPKPTPVTVERNGVKVTLDEGDPKVIARLLRAFEE